MPPDHVLCTLLLHFTKYSDQVHTVTPLFKILDMLLRGFLFVEWRVGIWNLICIGLVYL